MKRGRPPMTNSQYYLKYYQLINCLQMRVPMRTIAKEYKVGLSTVMRLSNRLKNGFFS